MENPNESDTFYQVDDLVRCVIVSIDQANDVCYASLTSPSSNIKLVFIIYIIC